MALIDCPDCNQKISDSAPTCISCGRLMRESQKRNLDNIKVMDFAQASPSFRGSMGDPRRRSFEEIIPVSGKSKDDLYLKINSWFVETVSFDDSIIAFQNKEAGKIMWKYVYELIEGVYTYDIKQTIDIDIKDEKIRVIIKNPFLKPTSFKGQRFDGYYRVLATKIGVDKARNEWRDLLNSLKEYLKKDTDW